MAYRLLTADCSARRALGPAVGVGMDEKKKSKDRIRWGDLVRAVRGPNTGANGSVELVGAGGREYAVRDGATGRIFIESRENLWKAN